jgi:chitin synthase
VLLICTQFILSLGNRPQGAKKMFMTSICVFVVIMIYNTFAALYIVIVQLKGGTDLYVGNNLFTNLIISTLSTVGLYFLMSFLYLDPWHMFTSSAQYFAMLPAYVCTLQVYAFCNTHDISWGTKGDNVIHTDLGAAVGHKGNTVELEMPSEQLDIDSGYDEALRNLRDRLEVKVEPVSEAQQQEDYYRAVRTYMVTAWLISNTVFAMAVSEVYDSTNVSNNLYLKLILWSVATLALFRAVGSSTYGIINVVHMVMEGKMRFDEKGVKMPDWVSSSGSKVSKASSKFSGASSWISGTSSKLSSLGSSLGKK